MFVPHIVFSCLFFSSLLQAQDTYPDGAFTFPPKLENQFDYSTFLRWAEGSVVTVQWNSTYDRNNLFFSQYGDDPNSQSIATNIAEKQFDWTVITTSKWTNLSIPFHFHVVNPEGSANDQLNGGIWSAGFFILAESSSSSSTTTTTSSSTRTPTIKPTTSEGASSTSSSAASTTAAATSLAGSSTPSPSSDSTNSSSSSFSGGAIAGTVVGCSLALFAFGGLLYWLGRRRRESKGANTMPQPQYPLAPAFYAQPPYQDNPYAQPMQRPVMVEAPNEKDRVEAEGDTPKSSPPIEMGAGV